MTIIAQQLELTIPCYGLVEVESLSLCHIFKKKQMILRAWVISMVVCIELVLDVNALLF